jgi:sarcosine oxidase subunit beta
MNDSRDVIVIGGGISGTSAAYELARRGTQVMLLERGDLHSMASGWSLAGVRQSGRHPAELPLAQTAVRRWEHLAEELESDVEYRQDGNLRLAITTGDVPAIRRVVDEGSTSGIPMEYIDGSDAVRELAPAIAPTVAGASFCPTDGHANNHLTVQAFARAAQRHGAEIRTGIEVTSLRVAGDRITGVETADGAISAGTVILAAGIYTPRLLAPLNLDLPLDIVLCPVVQTDVMEPTLKPVLGVSDGSFAGRQEASGRFRLTGESRPWREAWHTGANTTPSMGQVQAMIAGALDVLPVLADMRINRIWGGLIDRTPDVIPVIEKIPHYDGLVVAAGFSGHGFCLGPVTGEILADLAITGMTHHPIDAFTLARFAAGVARKELQLHG